MERPDTWIVTEDDERPARRDGTCFWCGAPIGSRHKTGECTRPHKSVIVDFTIRLPLLVPIVYDKKMIEDWYNDEFDDQWEYEELFELIAAWKEKTGKSLHEIMDAKFVSDANPQEDKDAVDSIG